VIESLPDVGRLTHIFGDATSPTFFLGSVAAFVSLTSSRLNEVWSRLRVLQDLAEDHPLRARAQRDVKFLKLRARYLSRGIYASLFSGICATALLADLFVSDILALKHAYFAASLFTIATLALGFGLVNFTLEARLQLREVHQD
jgi:hypothetical protein